MSSKTRPCEVRSRAIEAAAILMGRRQEGLERPTGRDILVKVNSGMIPAVNGTHLVEVSRVVKRKGAFLHNVMPLIAEAEHGAFLGMMGQAPGSRVKAG